MAIDPTDGPMMQETQNSSTPGWHLNYGTLLTILVLCVCQYLIHGSPINQVEDMISPPVTCLLVINSTRAFVDCFLSY